MLIENAIYNSSAFATIVAGLNAMKNEDYQPRYFYFHIILIIITAITVGFFAETRYKNFMENKKIRNDRLGQRHL